LRRLKLSEQLWQHLGKIQTEDGGMFVHLAKHVKQLLLHFVGGVVKQSAEDFLVYFWLRKLVQRQFKLGSILDNFSARD
jgi:hypothetical protein